MTPGGRHEKSPRRPLPGASRGRRSFDGRPCSAAQVACKPLYTAPWAPLGYVRGVGEAARDEGARMDIGNQIRERRQRLGFSQDELAQRLYVTRVTVSNWGTEGV